MRQVFCHCRFLSMLHFTSGGTLGCSLHNCSHISGEHLHSFKMHLFVFISGSLNYAEKSESIEPGRLIDFGFSRIFFEGNFIDREEVGET